tara:strand:+ start:90236 stop:91048 length:813 start_codon:yes stop_codon:yes gene_type:complete
MTDDLQLGGKISLRWQWNAKILCFALIFLPITVSLGFWQLQRAEQKHTILAAQDARIDAPAVDLKDVLTATDNQFRNVWVAGDIDNDKTLLLDNRVRHGRPGYEVLTPLRLVSEGKPLWILVNRGWLAGGQDRSKLPNVPQLKAAVLQGYLYRSEPGLVLKDEAWLRGVSPQIIQAVDEVKAADYLGGVVYAYTLRLRDNPGGDSDDGSNDRPVTELETGWQIVNASPEKHVGYAVQWFLMGLALIVLSLFANSNLAEVLRQWRREKKRG